MKLFCDNSVVDEKCTVLGLIIVHSVCVKKIFVMNPWILMCGKLFPGPEDRVLSRWIENKSAGEISKGDKGH